MPRKKKRKPYKIIVHFDNLEGTKFSKEITIPDGYSFAFGYAQHPRLVNDRGETERVFDWKAGFQVEYEPCYKPSD